MTVDDVVVADDQAAARVRVTLGDVTSHCAQFASISHGRISAALELWVDERSEEPPAWRASFTETDEETI